MPEDNVVGTRFLINTFFGAVAFATLLFAGWLGYVDLTTWRQMRDWEQRIKENQAEVRDIQRMQRDYTVESAKIDEAYKLIQPQLRVYEFIQTLGRTRPPQLVIDSIDWNEATIIVHGNLRGESEQASALLSNYVRTLAKEAKMGAVFREPPRLTGFDRGASNDVINFEISFYLVKQPKT